MKMKHLFIQEVGIAIDQTWNWCIPNKKKVYQLKLLFCFVQRIKLNC